MLSSFLEKIYRHGRRNSPNVAFSSESGLPARLDKILTGKRGVGTPGLLAPSIGGETRASLGTGASFFSFPGFQRAARVRLDALQPVEAQAPERRDCQSQ